MDPVLYDSFDRLLTDISTPQVVREIEAGGPPQMLWQQIIESGFADAMISEQSGGAGLGLSDAFSLFFLCGRHALPVPLAQTIVARSICALGGVAIPDEPIAIAPMPVTSSGDTIDCRNVPFGKLAQWVLVSHAGPSDAHTHLLLPASQASRTETGVNDSLQAHLLWKDPLSSGVVLEGDGPWLEIAAAVTAALMAGAMDTVLQTTVRYAGERVQFGRPIGKFQAIQQQLSVLAELTTASRMAAELGCQETAAGTPNALAAAVAKARASEAAGTVVSIAHGVHAAMGITAEYDLQLYTRRLIEWRTDYGSAGYWNRRVGDAVLSSDAASTLEFMLPTFFPVAAPD
jgi:acyl-CoA dehydrogenase